MCELPQAAYSEPGMPASAYAYALNDEILDYGVVSTDEPGGGVEIDCDRGVYPAGVIYADMIDFDDNESPYLVVFRADAVRGCASAVIYDYNPKTRQAEIVDIISKGYNIPEGELGEFTIGFNDEKRYIVYNLYADGAKTASVFYTVIDGTALQYLATPEAVDEVGVLSYTRSRLHPEVDVSYYNDALGEFFCMLKDASAAGVANEDISDRITEAEEEKLDAALAEAARFRDFDICRYSDIADCREALENPETDAIFYSVNNLYDLGDQIYYVRFSTDQSFYNHALFRRTDTEEDGYQLLSVRTDSIPLSGEELESAKNEYMHSNLVYKKAKGSIVERENPLSGLASFKKPITLTKLFSRDIRQPAALIGGGICLALFVVLWVNIASEEEV